MSATQNPSLFNRSSFMRYFADRDLAAAAQPTLAQGMAQWVSFTDAMTLYTALEFRPATDRPAHGAAGDARRGALKTVCADFARARTAMADLITRSCATTTGAARLKFPAPQVGTDPEIAAMYSPIHRFVRSVQREMETRLAPVRAAVRVSMAGASPDLQQLAMLDAALDTIVGERERRLLASAPQLLEKRFKQLLAAHQHAVAATDQADDLSTWMLPGAWLAQFRDELRQVLLAEWDVRLQPVLGLVAAFEKELSQSP